MVSSSRKGRQAQGSADSASPGADADARALLLEATERVGLPLEIDLGLELGSLLLSRPRPRAGSKRLLMAEGRRAKAGAQGALVTPGLLAWSLAPALDVISRSTLPPAARIVGHRTPRVSLLRAVLILAELASPDAAATLRRLARSLHGVAPDAGADALVMAATVELSLIAQADLAEREEAAARLAGLSPHEQLFGVQR